MCELNTELMIEIEKVGKKGFLFAGKEFMIWGIDKDKNLGFANHNDEQITIYSVGDAPNYRYFLKKYNDHAGNKLVFFHTNQFNVYVDAYVCYDEKLLKFRLINAENAVKKAIGIAYDCDLISDSAWRGNNAIVRINTAVRKMSGKDLIDYAIGKLGRDCVFDLLGGNMAGGGMKHEANLTLETGVFYDDNYRHIIETELSKTQHLHE